MARQDILDQSRKPLISQMNPGMGSGVDKRDKQLERIKRQQQQILDSADGDIEASYITKDPTTRDKYDIAFGSLNPGSVSKAKKYHNLEQKRLEIENEKINLEGARDFMNQVYANQRGNINSGYDNLNRVAGLKNDISLSSALATAGGAGATVGQRSGIKAQAANNLAAQLLENQAQRDAALAQVDAQEANIPVTLSNIGAQNTSIDATRAQEDLAKAQAEYYRRPQTSGGGGGYSSRSSQSSEKSDWTKGDGGNYYYKGINYPFTLEEAAAINELYKDGDFDKWFDALMQGQITRDELISKGEINPASTTPQDKEDDKKLSDYTKGIGKATDKLLTYTAPAFYLPVKGLYKGAQWGLDKILNSF